MTLAITNGTIIDGRGDEPLTGMTLLIEGERIVTLDRAARVNVPRGATVIDARGSSVLPGLIDTHVHFLVEYPALTRQLTTPPSLRLFEAIPRMKATLAAGVTTVRDAGGTPAGVKLAVERGLVAGPRMQVAVSIITQTGGHGDGYYPCCIDLGFFGLHLPDVPQGVADGEDEVRYKVREVLRALSSPPPVACSQPPMLPLHPNSRLRRSAWLFTRQPRRRSVVWRTRRGRKGLRMLCWPGLLQLSTVSI